MDEVNSTIDYEIVKGLAHFKLRDKNVGEAISQFEIENEIIFPTLYRLFLKTFKQKISLPLVEEPKYGIRSLFDFGLDNYPDLVQLDLIEYEFSEEKFDTIFDGIDEIDTNEMFLIGTTPLKEGLFVGLKDNLYDKIILYNHTDEIQFKHLANDIFEFISHFESKLHNRNISQLRLENLFRNWGEEFWRIKEYDD